MQSLRATATSRCSAARRIPSKSRASTVRVQAFQVTLRTPGGDRVCQMDNQQSLLEGALAAGVDVPHLCKTGSCGVCAARVLEGSVLRDDFLLDDDQADMGFVLLCSTKATSDAVVATEQEKELHTLPYGL